jgi:hypothetical protein
MRQRNNRHNDSVLTKLRMSKQTKVTPTTKPRISKQTETKPRMSKQT